MRPAYTITGEPGHVVATALHAGHELRPELADIVALGEAVRRREEDPGTDLLTAVAPLRVVVHRSRFEVDLNRPRESAVYRDPDLSWGLDVWAGTPPAGIVTRSLEIYDAFYTSIEEQFDALAARGPFVVFDIHSYNHRRGGPHRPPASETRNPEVNIGTGSLDRVRWARVVDGFIDDLGCQNVCGHRLDVRENIRFEGGHFAHWVHERYADAGCVLAIELKKVFMDEWTGEIDLDHLGQVCGALRATVPGVVEALNR